MLSSRSSAARARRIAVGAVVPALLAGALTAWVLARPLAPHRLTRLTQSSPPTGTATGKPAATTSSAFTTEVSRHYGLPANASGYSVIVVTGQGETWAFGGTNPGGPSAPVATQWNGAITATATLPGGLTSFITDAGATSSDIWAASQYGRYVLQYDGSHWRVAKRWQQGQVTGLTAVTPTDVWVFGTSADGTSDIGTWNYDGSDWQQVTGLAGSIVRASAISPTDIWAIAASPASYSVVHLEGTVWQQVATGSALDGVQVRDILAVSDSDVWVLGDRADAAGVQLVLLNWNGASWSNLGTRIDAWAGRLAPGAGHTVLATATPVGPSASGLIIQASAVGGRLVVSQPSSLTTGGISDVALAGHARMWVSGAILTRLGGDAVIWTSQLPPAAGRIGA